MLALLAAISLAQDVPGTYELPGSRGPGKGVHVVLLAGDEEYRSEEMLPQLARILSERHGFVCTVSFSLNENGEIDPNERVRQSGLEALERADVVVMMLRFRRWPDSQMKRFSDYYLSGKPFLAIRTSTHAFDFPDGSPSPFARFGWRSKDWQGGFGEQVLGENWISHWGNHGTQATSGVKVADHPILRGVGLMFGTTDVYEALPPKDATILMRGMVVDGMKPTDRPAPGRKKRADGVEQDLNEPMMPIVWIREPLNASGKRNKVLTTTFGAATDFENESFRRLLVNGVYWLAGLEPAQAAHVDYVGEYKPSAFGFEGFRKGVKPADFARKPLQ